MKIISYCALIASVSIGQGAEAKSYIPIGSPLSTPAWAQGAFQPVKAEARPFLPGMRPVELELLEDALRRKMPITISESREKAHAKIIRNSLRDPVKRSHINGILAEALFLEKNPHWGYVGKPNAPYNDVYSRIRSPKGTYIITAQIKTHLSGDPVIYAKDMKDDPYGRFLVPNDHVDQLRKNWLSQIKEHEAAGRRAEVVDARKQFARIQGLGFTMGELDKSYTRAARYALREQNAGYISLGASAAMAIGPELWNWWSTGLLTDQTVLRAAHMGSIIATERVSTAVLSHNAKSTLPVERANTSTLSRLGALQGSMRGNTIIGLAMLSTDTAWSVYEHGGNRAFQSETFYTNMGGSAGSLAGMIGMPVAYAVTVMSCNPIIGGAAGLATGFAVGTAGSIGGRVGMRKILEAVSPEFIHKAEDAAILDAQKNIKTLISQVQRGLNS